MTSSKDKVRIELDKARIALDAAEKICEEENLLAQKIGIEKLSRTLSQLKQNL